MVVRIWDLRRLVLPINYFIEKPFQNWTRTSADILGTVYVYVDYGAPVEEISNELRRIVEASDRWDGKVCGLLRRGCVRIRFRTQWVDDAKGTNQWWLP